MSQKFTDSITGYLLIISLFFIDLIINSIVYQPYSFCLMAGFIVLACYARHLSYLVIASILLMVQSSLYYTSWYLPLLYSIPLIMMNWSARRLLYPNSWLAPLILIQCLGLQLFTSAWITAGIAPAIPYTSGTFLANMIIAWCFSLTYIMQGNLDNHL